jgi:hypothetical protein
MPLLKAELNAPLGAGKLKPVRNFDGLTVFRYDHKFVADPANDPAMEAMERNGIVGDVDQRQLIGKYEVTHSRKTKGNAAPHHTAKFVIPTLQSIPSGVDGIDVATQIGQSLIKVEVIFDPKATEETRAKVTQLLSAFTAGKPLFNALKSDSSFY